MKEIFNHIYFAVIAISLIDILSGVAIAYHTNFKISRFIKGILVKLSLVLFIVFMDYFGDLIGMKAVAPIMLTTYFGMEAISIVENLSKHDTVAQGVYNVLKKRFDHDETGEGEGGE